MEVYQKTPHKVKHTDITEKSPNWFQQLVNIKSLQKNPTKSKKKIKTLEQTPAVLKSSSSNLPDGSVPKDPAQIQTYRHHSEIPNLVLATGKHQKSAPAELRNGSSNLPEWKCTKRPRPKSNIPTLLTNLQIGPCN